MQRRFASPEASHRHDLVARAICRDTTLTAASGTAVRRRASATVVPQKMHTGELVAYMDLTASTTLMIAEGA